MHLLFVGVDVHTFIWWWMGGWVGGKVGGQVAMCLCVGVDGGGDVGVGG